MLKSIGESPFLKIITIIISLIPIVWAFNFIQNTGGNVFSQDYVGNQFIYEAMAKKQFHPEWMYYSGHLLLIPNAIRFLLIRYFHWNLNQELMIGFVFALLKFGLLGGILTAGLKKRFAFMLWPAISILLFSVSQLVILTYGDTTLPMGLELLGLSLGLWGLRFYRDSFIGLALMVLGGFLSTWSWGVGVTWLTFLFVLIPVARKKPTPYIIWLAGFLLSHSAMKFIIQIIGPQHHVVLSWLNLHFIIEGIGQSFGHLVMGYSLVSSLTGLTGIFLAIIAFSFNIVNFNQINKTRFYYATALVIYALLSFWLFSLFRAFPGPWYGAIAAIFWVGLLGLLVNCLENIEFNFGSPRFKPYFKSGLLSVLIIIPLVQVGFNMKLPVSQFLLATRNLTSESCFRHYDSAPTFCEYSIYSLIWPENFIFRHGQFYENYRLSVLSPNQTWWLQGDYPLETVQVYNQSQNQTVQWLKADDTPVEFPSWTSIDHLNLAMPVQNSLLTWQIKMPAKYREARFKTVVRFKNHLSNAVNKASLQILSGKNVLKRFEFNPVKGSERYSIDVSLPEQTGKTLTLVLNSKSVADKELMILETPRIQFAAIKKMHETLPQQYQPDNIDAIVQSKKSYLIKKEVIQPWTQTSESKFFFNQNKPVLARDFSYLAFDAEVPENIKSARYMALILFVKRGNETIRRYFIYPFTKDSRKHRYWVNLKNLELNPSDKFWLQTINPFFQPSAADSKESIHFSNIQLLKTPDPPNNVTGNIGLSP